MATERLERTKVESSLKRYVRSYILHHFPCVRKICRCGTFARSAQFGGSFPSGNLQLPEMVHRGTRRENVSFPCHVPYEPLQHQSLSTAVYHMVAQHNVCILFLQYFNAMPTPLSFQCSGVGGAETVVSALRQL